jgi:hypothetical protein
MYTELAKVMAATEISAAPLNYPGRKKMIVEA